MYASKTLEQRNNDPYPFFRPQYRDQISEFGLKLWGYTEGKEAVRRPRPEFQHGALEANPILVDVRQFMADRQGMNNPKGTKHAVEAALHDWGGYVQWVQGNVTTREERTHAHRVFTLWLAVFA